MDVNFQRTYLYADPIGGILEKNDGNGSEDFTYTWRGGSGMR